MRTLFLLLISFLCLPSAAQTGTLQGRVVDAVTGEPLPGASVSLVGTTRGAITDEDGHFQISDIPAGIYEVQASFIGFVTETKAEVTVLPRTRRVIHFALDENKEILPAVVLCGGSVSSYWAQRGRRPWHRTAYASTRYRSEDLGYLSTAR